MTTATNTASDVLALVRRQIGARMPDEAQVDVRTPFEDLGFSDRDVAGVLTALEGQAGVILGSIEPSDVQTVGDLVEAVNGMLTSGGSTEAAPDVGPRPRQRTTTQGRPGRRPTTRSVGETDGPQPRQRTTVRGRTPQKGRAVSKQGGAESAPEGKPAQPTGKPAQPTGKPVQPTADSRPTRTGASGPTRTRPGGRPTKPAPAGKPLALVFSGNSASNRIEGYDFPTDMPAVRWPEGYTNCSASEAQKIRQAWVFAHYYTWRTQQVMEYLVRSESRRSRMWNDGYVAQIKDASGNYVNHSPRGWFGPYDEKRFSRIRASIDKVWDERFRGTTFTVKCRTNDSNTGAHPCYRNNPQTGSQPSANHIVYGTINFCNGWFDKPVSRRAKTVVHEVFHWLRIPGTGWWVADIHDYWSGSCLQYRAARALYGERAAYLASDGGCKDWNYNRAWRNNDNYALFIYMLGKAIYDRKAVNGMPMTQFPSSGFKW